MPMKTFLSAEALAHIASRRIGILLAKKAYGIGERRVCQIWQGGGKPDWKTVAERLWGKLEEARSWMPREKTYGRSWKPRERTTARSWKPRDRKTNDATNLEELLPPTSRIQWEWRTEKCHKIGEEKPRYKLLQMAEIASTKEISMLSTANLAKGLQEILESRDVEVWRRGLATETEEQCQRAEQVRVEKEGEIQHLQAYMAVYKVHHRVAKQNQEKVEGMLSGPTDKIWILATGHPWTILGFSRTTHAYRVAVEA